MENHLEIVFQDRIIVLGLDQNTQLSELIEKLNTDGAVSDDIRAELDNLRESFNPDNHEYISDENIEAYRIDALELKSLLFGRLNDS